MWKRTALVAIIRQGTVPGQSVSRSKSAPIGDLGACGGPLTGRPQPIGDGRLTSSNRRTAEPKTNPRDLMTPPPARTFTAALFRRYEAAPPPAGGRGRR